MSTPSSSQPGQLRYAAETVARLGPSVGLAGLSAGLAALGVCGLLWSTNTIAPRFDREPVQTEAMPGETVVIETKHECGEQHSFVYRETLLGRWQRTHRNGEQNLRQWNDLRSEDLLTLSVCAFGPDAGLQEFFIPETVEPGIVALCGSGRSCAKVRVVDPNTPASNTTEN